MNTPRTVRSGPIRFATAGRFARPRPVAAGDTAPPSDGICPQPASRLEALMGPPPGRHPRSEDCLHLTVTAPAAPAAGRPVLVWFHGGGFNSGSGILDWYDGSALAAEQDVVVVGASYRLGALGYLVHDGVSEGNLGLYDQMEALRWVRAHIADHGGDPGNVTVFGQSAGALSALLLLRTPEARSLFRRVILQSPPLSIATRTPAEARETGRIFAAHLGGDPRTASTDELIAAQARTAADHQRRSGDFLAPPFGPVSGTAPLPAETGPAPFAGHAPDVLYGWNADDMSAFPEGPSDSGSVAERTRRVYEEPLRGLHERLAHHGARVHGYRLDWRPSGSPHGATHCVEIPLLLGSERAWRHAPMLGTLPWAEVDAAGRGVRAAWAAFARTGDPGALTAPLVAVPR
ncbi:MULTISPECIES: carboxylesterase family protein [unclassified Streptomyces]|uniref:carboxylesterase family protein n=1 Tax=unclassified Streptomyces TaxID=2593676 RepID=UPI000365C371|nr:MULTISPECIES: carboxylesterase family protein [unclassified Streptomyces]MYY07074.1 carboxylesterase family protein [Streptomyces sp. SID4913]